METGPEKAAARLGPLTAHVELFLNGLPAAGYAPPAVASRRWIIRAFIRWIDAKRLRVENLNEADFFRRSWSADQERWTRKSGRRFTNSWPIFVSEACAHRCQPAW